MRRDLSFAKVRARKQNKIKIKKFKKEPKLGHCMKRLGTMSGVLGDTFGEHYLAKTTI